MTTERALGALDNEVDAALADDAAFRAWYERTWPKVYGYVASRAAGDATLAEEITQQAYVAAIDGRARFDGRSDSATWLCAIARNKLIDHFRRLDREERRGQRMVVRELQLGVPSTVAAWTAAEDRQAIEHALRSLPALQRLALTLVVLDGLSVPEVARAIGKSAAATQSLVARGRDGFRRAWSKETADA
jgi:RNA polymerase sigma-70 factor (ECF subfamily)